MENCRHGQVFEEWQDENTDEDDKNFGLRKGLAIWKKFS